MNYFEQLEKDIRNLQYHQPLYKLLKRELTLLGHWKNKPRGNPQKGGQKSVIKRRGGEDFSD